MKTTPNEASILLAALTAYEGQIICGMMDGTAASRWASIKADLDCIRDLMLRLTDEISLP